MLGIQKIKTITCLDQRGETQCEDGERKVKIATDKLYQKCTEIRVCGTDCPEYMLFPTFSIPNNHQESA